MPHPLRQVIPRPRGTNNGMAQLRAPGLRRGELLKLLLALPLRHLSGPTLCCKLALKEGGLPEKAFDILTSRSNVVAFSTSTLDTFSSATPSARVDWSSTSFTQRAVLSHTIAASWAEVSTASTTVTRAASTVVAASHVRVTSTSNAGTSTLPQDKSYRNKTQEGMREHGGSQRYAGNIFLSF
jgi:hypothetical protein